MDWIPNRKWNYVVHIEIDICQNFHGKNNAHSWLGTDFSTWKYTRTLIDSVWFTFFYFRLGISTVNYVHFSISIRLERRNSSINATFTSDLSDLPSLCWLWIFPVAIVFPLQNVCFIITWFRQWCHTSIVAIHGWNPNKLHGAEGSTESINFIHFDYRRLKCRFSHIAVQLNTWYIVCIIYCLCASVAVGVREILNYRLDFCILHFILTIIRFWLYLFTDVNHTNL